MSAEQIEENKSQPETPESKNPSGKYPKSTNSESKHQTPKQTD